MVSGLVGRHTLHPTPYTLYRAPSTLHLAPYTLHPSHPAPCTLHPTPCTLHRTLHPTPYTLRPRWTETTAYLHRPTEKLQTFIDAQKVLLPRILGAYNLYRNERNIYVTKMKEIYHFGCPPCAVEREGARLRGRGGVREREVLHSSGGGPRLLRTCTALLRCSRPSSTPRRFRERQRET